MKVTNNIPTKKSAGEIEFYLENGPKFGKVLKQLRDYILNDGNYIYREYIRLCIEEFNNEIKFPFTKQKSENRIPFGREICISINNCVAHGRFKRTPSIKEDDIISVDCGLSLPIYNDYWYYLNFDAAFTVQKSNKDKWIEAPQTALIYIKEHNSKNIKDIAQVIECNADSYNLNQVLALTGHGIGKKLHEAPIIHNATGNYKDMKLFDGLVFCAEPVYTECLDDKSQIEDIYIDNDEWSIYTQSGARATHWETMFLRKDSKLIDLVGITNW